VDLPPKNSILKIPPALAVVSQITVTLGVVILFPLSQLRRLCRSLDFLSGKELS